MQGEVKLIHDMVNRLTIVQARLKRLVSKSKEYTKEELVEIVNKTNPEIDNMFELINNRKSELSE